MYAQVEKPQENGDRVANNTVPQSFRNKGGGNFKDNRAQSIVLRKLRVIANNSPTQRKTIIENFGQPCKYGPQNDPQEVVVGHTMNAWLDPKKPVRGQSANVNTSQDYLMAWIKSIYPLAKGGLSVKGHLLNDNLGGTALNNNLYPISKGANGIHLSTAENYVKNEVWNKGRAVKYSVEAVGSTDYTGANSSNREATFKTTVRPWNNVEDKNDIDNPEYTANIVSNLGSPKFRYAEDENSQTPDNNSGWGLIKPQEPAKSVGELSSEEVRHRMSQPRSLKIDTSTGYDEHVATTKDISGNEKILENAMKMTPDEFVEEYITDSSRDIIDFAIDKCNDISDAQSKVIDLGIINEFIHSLPEGLTNAMNVNEEQLQDALLMFVQEEFESRKAIPMDES